MSKYDSVGLLTSAGNSAKSAFIGVEVTLDLYVRGVNLAHRELDIVEKRQAIRHADVEHELTLAAAANAAKRKKLGA